ncbi:MAG TPA: tetratricopeptide repeat protein [Thermoanaerobaculia bacterium]|nr:tetratricopeptide repeat protein [Thermoanaerobaculia bacterium]
MRSWILVGCLLLAACAMACGGTGGRTVPLKTVPALDLPRVEASPPVSETGVEALSLFGQPLPPPPLPPEVQTDREAKLAAARSEAEARPDDVDAQIWLGRRIAYLGRYREAIDVYTRALERHPDEPRLLRHRGHRYISIRRFDRAVEDLEKAARLIEGRPDEVEPDGLPNARNTPVSTLQTNIWYHLGLANYYLGDLDSALRAFRECLEVSKSADMQVATTHWLYMILRRLGRVSEAEELLAPIRTDMDVIENRAYHWLVLMYKGEIPADSILSLASQEGLDPATLGYGVGNWHLYNGRREEAVAAFRQVLASDQWSAFGYIAAEADMKRLGETLTP